MTPRRRRAFHPGDHAAGEAVGLDPEESHHVLRVLRLAAGDALSVFDGRGREWDGVLEEAARGAAVVRLAREIEDPVEPSLRLTLYQGLCRPERVELVLQKGTELGVFAFRVVAAERSEAPPPNPARLDRWRRIVLEACKQSGRRRLPSLETPPPAPPEPPDGVPAFLLEPGADVRPLGDLLRRDAPAEVWVAVGPEGGFAQEEAAAWALAGWTRAAMGPRILRTETAGIVACALVLHAWGDLGAAARP